MKKNKIEKVLKNGNWMIGRQAIDRKEGRKMILKVRAVGKETYDWLILCGVRDIVYSGNLLTDCLGLREDDYVLLNLPTDEGKTDVETCVQEKKTPKWKKMEILIILTVSG